MKRKEKTTLIIRFSGVYGVCLFNSSVTFNVFYLSFSTMKLRWNLLLLCVMREFPEKLLTPIHMLVPFAKSTHLYLLGKCKWRMTLEKVKPWLFHTQSMFLSTLGGNPAQGFLSPFLFEFTEMSWSWLCLPLSQVMSGPTLCCWYLQVCSPNF